jgi:hypothetical protein
MTPYPPSVTAVTHATPNIQAAVRLFGAENDGVDDHLSLRPGILLIVDPHGMRDLVDQNPDSRVRRLIGADDDSLALVVAPAARRPVDRLERDGEPERVSEPLKRLQQMLMRITAQRLDRRLQRRRGLACRHLGTVEHRHSPEQGPVSPVSSPLTRSRSLIFNGARIQIAFSPLRT